MLLAAAITADILSIIPGVNDVVAVIAPIVIEIIAREKGMTIFGSKGVGWSLLTILIELIPIISWYPTFTHRVIVVQRAHKKMLAQQG